MSTHISLSIPEPARFWTERGVYRMEQRHRIILWDKENSAVVETLDLTEKQMELLSYLQSEEYLTRDIEIIDVDSLTFYST